MEEEVVQSLDIERVRAALKALTPEERDIIMNKVEHLPQKRSRAEEAEKHSG